MSRQIDKCCKQDVKFPKLQAFCTVIFGGEENNKTVTLSKIFPIVC